MLMESPEANFSSLLIADHRPSAAAPNVAVSTPHATGCADLGVDGARVGLMGRLVADVAPQARLIVEVPGGRLPAKARTRRAP
jgi:hypothetical protein